MCPLHLVRSGSQLGFIGLPQLPAFSSHRRVLRPAQSAWIQPSREVTGEPVSDLLGLPRPRSTSILPVSMTAADPAHRGTERGTPIGAMTVLASRSCTDCRNASFAVSVRRASRRYDVVPARERRRHMTVHHPLIMAGRRCRRSFGPRVFFPECIHTDEDPAA
jgi:hypothetical protein